MTARPRHVLTGNGSVRSRRIALLLVAGVVTALAARAYPADFKIVANPSVSVARLTRAEASSLFLKKLDKWPDGTPVVPVDQDHDSPLRRLFTREIHERTVEMIDAFWQRQVFSGRGTPPTTKASDAEVVSFVASSPGAIGYVSVNTATSGVKEIRIQ